MTKDEQSRIERERNTQWYRRQAQMYTQRLTEYLDNNPGRKTKARMAIVAVLNVLYVNHRSEDEAYEAIVEAERMGWQAPATASKVIARAMGR